VERVVRHIFSMRQKYCRRGYGTLLPPDDREEVTQKLFQRAEVQDTLRPFELTVDQCLRLAEVYSEHLVAHPEVAAYDYRAPKNVEVL